MDVLFINPPTVESVYQDLTAKFKAIESPTWSLLLAQSMRSFGYKVDIFDVNAEALSIKNAIVKLKKYQTRLFCFVVYGQNPNSGTVNMEGAIMLANEIKKEDIKTNLPLEVLKSENSIDIILCNEGVYALRNLLDFDFENKEDLTTIKGIGFRLNDKPILSLPEKVVPQEKMDTDLPGYAWDLLPYKKKPLDLYRSHFWHAEYDHKKRSPFAAIYTSLGCMFKCEFCMINMINRNDTDPIGDAANYAKMRFWSPDFIINEFEKLVDMGVRTLRISDEMFLLNKKYYVPLCNKLIERRLGEKLNMWAYSRIDTVTKPELLKLIRKAGIKWLALGIESSNKEIRLEVTKGKFKNIDIFNVVKNVHDADIEIIANYLFGLPGDTLETMQETLDLSLKLNTIAWNGYPVMALPGSKLYKQAKDKGAVLPNTYNDYSFHSYGTQPLPTKKLKPKEILEFRDMAFTKYHTYKPFLDKINSKYGKVALNNINELTKVKLKRKLYGDKIIE